MMYTLVHLLMSSNPSSRHFCSVQFTANFRFLILFNLFSSVFPLGDIALCLSNGFVGGTGGGDCVVVIGSLTGNTGITGIVF